MNGWFFYARYPFVGKLTSCALHIRQYELVCGDGNGKGEEKVEDHRKCRPAPTGGFLLNNNYGNKAWGIEQGEEEKSRCVGGCPRRVAGNA